MADQFTPEERSRVMASVKSKDTTPELIVRRLAHGLGFRYRLHVANLSGKPDLVFPRLRKAIFVHGCFWHSHGCRKISRPATRTNYWNEKLDRNRRRDRRNLAQLKRDGWRTLVVWECQTTARRREILRRRIEKFLAE